ncbi:MAG: hypothetical protein KKE37_05850 [Verrucomicrobia bacterium]|nr:hypothetical protein [Verrucomicrobiota bacterium]MBU4248648.1 hypothetical protein [Verrucomicrobiota bacterium]MBU4290109.1 hypothetical protein [Verrucomicrobiota bacterium]MBU4428861.1 hypothetical protein [Verrucomicrobiota bacterium]MCG2679254.1 hypothetical protein [Kiritimatiellia bacterium]
MATAAVFWIVGLVITAGMTTNAMQNALRPLVKFAFNGLAILALVAAVVSFYGCTRYPACKGTRPAD